MENDKKDIGLFCKMCGYITPHMNLGTDVDPAIQWKCMRCGEYNKYEEYV